jgi:hypothetical protein
MGIGGFAGRALCGAALFLCLITALPEIGEAASFSKRESSRETTSKRCPALIIAKCTPPARPQCVRTQNGCCAKLACRKK